jgi:hypothetical protein
LHISTVILIRPAACADQPSVWPDPLVDDRAADGIFRVYREVFTDRAVYEAEVKATRRASSASDGRTCAVVDGGQVIQ